MTTIKLSTQDAQSFLAVAEKSGFKVDWGTIQKPNVITTSVPISVSKSFSGGGGAHQTNKTTIPAGSTIYPNKSGYSIGGVPVSEGVAKLYSKPTPATDTKNIPSDQVKISYQYQPPPMNLTGSNQSPSYTGTMYIGNKQPEFNAVEMANIRDWAYSPAGVITSAFSNDPFMIRTLFYTGYASLGGYVSIFDKKAGFDMANYATTQVRNIREEHGIDVFRQYRDTTPIDIGGITIYKDVALEMGKRAAVQNVLATGTMLTGASGIIGTGAKTLTGGLQVLTIGRAIDNPTPENIFFASVIPARIISKQFSYESFKLPLKEGDITYRGVAFRGHGLIGYASGIKLGTPTMDLSGLGSGSGYVPVSKFEYNLIQKNIGSVGISQAEISKLNIMYDLDQQVKHLTPSKIQDKLIAAENFKNPEKARDVFTKWVIDYAKRNEVVYGSSTAYAQMDPAAYIERGIKIHDFDIKLIGSTERNQAAITDLLGRFRAIGEDVFIRDPTIPLIETPKGHAVDIHTSDAGGSSGLALEGSYGITYGKDQPLIKIGDIKNVMSLEEFATRKGGSIGTFRIVDQKFIDTSGLTNLEVGQQIILPEAHRLKDVVDFYIASKSLLGGETTTTSTFKSLWNIPSDVKVDLDIPIQSITLSQSPNVLGISGLISTKAVISSVSPSFRASSSLSSFLDAVSSGYASGSSKLPLSFSPSLFYGKGSASGYSPSRSGYGSLSTSSSGSRSGSPSLYPKVSPSISPSISPSVSPSGYPSPSRSPSRSPSPSGSPSGSPSPYPSINPKSFIYGSSSSSSPYSKTSTSPRVRFRKPNIIRSKVMVNPRSDPIAFRLSQTFLGSATHPEKTKKRSKEFLNEFFGSPMGLSFGKFETKESKKSFKQIIKGGWK